MAIVVVPDLHGCTAWQASAQHWGGPVKTDSELAAAVRRHRYCRDLLYRGRAEQSYTATHTATGVGVKLRPDLLVSSRAGRQLTLIDFKTTSAPDLAHFLATIEKYDYDRQAALYLDVLGATRFLIIGVQKKAGPLRDNQVWRVELAATPGLIEQGRKKYNTLLRHYARHFSAAARLPKNLRCP